jgi:signal transduction histidine kinase
LNSVLHEFLERYPGIALEASDEGVILGSNGMLDKIVGRDLVGSAIPEILDESSLGKWNVLRGRGVGGEPYMCELAFPTPDSVEVRRFMATRGAVEPVIWLVEQPRDPKMEQLYEELTSLNSELSSMQREVARERSRLARALVVAESAVRARDDVLAIVSHDLRNPMNTIRMAAGLLQMDFPEEKKTQQIEAIIRSVDRMTTLIADLLDVSAMEAGQFQIEPGPTSMSGLLKELCALLETQAHEKKQRLTCEAVGEIPVISGDRDRLLQALMNLAGNALKFTPQGGSVMVRAERIEQEVIISVEDSGPGIAEADIEHVFDRYWHAARKAKGGTGLGLAITKGIVDAHGGRIWVERGRKTGAKIVFTLAVSPEEKAPRAGLTLPE